ncbi:hypothetical protein ATANTOWER_013070 [Ataeniobius toweri]|uniref:Uncharacterized protein n=1 Tax=Ataeniobius toweri TaxID=208326 RepID=A0ABU7CJG5_9TELE|nr:hypothetical protein [Ataeniobius toweri]
MLCKSWQRWFLHEHHPWRVSPSATPNPFCTYEVRLRRSERSSRDRSHRMYSEARLCKALNIRVFPPES